MQVTPSSLRAFSIQRIESFDDNTVCARDNAPLETKKGSYRFGGANGFSPE